VPCSGFAGLVVYRDRVPRANGTPAEHLAARGIAWLEGGPRGPYAVVVDLPLAGNAVRRIREETGVTLGRVSTATNPDSNVAVEDTAPADRNRDPAVPPAADDGAPRASAFRLPTDWVAFVESTDWDSGEPRGVVVAIQTSVADIYERVAPAERFGEYTFNQIFLTVLAVVGGLLLIIQAVAFLMGLGLARSITGSVHELFVGTERVRRGDFTHKIAIRSRDQLGELAESFNSMTASIEDLLAQKAEKERLEQELRIARSIQMSLLPQGGLATAGFALTAHCEPAREVGGDYYDYLPIDADRMGILIADVSGKGTSAALYMAELKGIVLSLSQVHASPRELLIDANRILSRHLDSRSFITITYAVLDLRERTLRYARAGHCPLIYMPGPYCDDRAAQVLTPDGMVVGLQLDEGQMFSRHLEEATIPFGPGDLFLLYTDGITEAMNPEGDCFGDDRLAALVTGHAHLPAEELRERILRDVRAFAGSVAQQDDMTMVLLRVDDVKSAAA
jgi:serine phosphatase RsbU (regulator of sigma subunit)